MPKPTRNSCPGCGGSKMTVAALCFRCHRSSWGMPLNLVGGANSDTEQRRAEALEHGIPAAEPSFCPGAAAHYWVLDRNNLGDCRNCGEQREFRTVLR